MMQGLALDLKNHRVKLVEFEIPKITDTTDGEPEVVVKVALSGVCGTDLHTIEGKYEADDGVVLGHEFVGTVTEVAKNEKVFKVGDRVAVNPNLTCVSCDECRRDRLNYCLRGDRLYVPGNTINGGFAPYCKVRTSIVYKLDNSLPFEQAVVVEPLSCIIHTLDLIPRIIVGWKILVIGAGIIGLLWNCLLHHFGHRDVTVLEMSSTRRKTFERLELGFPILSWEEASECAKNCQDLWKFDMLIDTSGNPEAVSKAYPFLRHKALLVFFGVADPAKTMTITPYEMYRKELTLVGTRFNTHVTFQRALDMIRAMGDRYISKERLHMKKFKLEDYEKAIQALHDRKYTKIIFDFS